ncbi:phosphatidylserine decarboxylase [Texcoconibacillus texcoconensis]|uniref:Phosphatidylserine decarboxylase n=1 Tax=Texcoconibacillus texcoconensis TaxID=1095777 RepID=A0A840QTY1_9BACI|nr:phosphatidylserine decarboxylase [Texcoconibacillus texcoconensis]
MAFSSISVRSHPCFGQFIGFLAAFCPKSILFRTVFWLSRCFLSEVNPFSDSFLAFSLLSVRSQSFFGQFFGFLAAFCPKSTLFRTVYRLSRCFLSEVNPFSDSFLASSLLSVRSQSTFGQFFGFLFDFCPKSPLFRTVYRLSRCFLSEVNPFSDSFLAFSLFSVRSQSFFGQFFGFLAAFCPKSPLFRTVFWLSRCFLSEVTLVSDSFLASSLLSVRSQSTFGQFIGFLAAFCPKSPLFRTVYQLSRCFLSEVTPFSDWFLAANQVPSQIHSIHSLLQTGQRASIYGTVPPD